MAKKYLRTGVWLDMTAGGHWLLWRGDLEPIVVHNESGPAVVQTAAPAGERDVVVFASLDGALEAAQMIADMGTPVWLSELAQYERDSWPAGDGWAVLPPSHEEIE